MFTISMTDKQRVTVTFRAVDGAGNGLDLPAGTTLSATTDDAAIASAIPSPDGAMSVDVVSVDAPAGATSDGHTLVHVTAALPDGTSISEDGDVTITPSAALTLVGTVGTPTAR